MIGNSSLLEGMRRVCMINSLPRLLVLNSLDAEQSTPRAHFPLKNPAVAAWPHLRYARSDAPVAQLDRALPSEGRGQGFESLRARQFPPRNPRGSAKFEPA